MTIKVQPKNKNELIKIIEDTIKKEGFDCDLNFIDTCCIKDMSYLFSGSKFNGDISGWDVSNVETMRSMFEDSVFNRDISRWTPRKLRYADNMFTKSKFNRDLSKWRLSKKIFGTIVEDMFKFSPLEDKEEFWPEKV